jgi:uncharacterized membrane protein YvbJ
MVSFVKKQEDSVPLVSFEKKQDPNPADRLEELVNSLIKDQKIGVFKAEDLLYMAQVALGFHPVEIVIKYLHDEPEKSKETAISLINSIADIFSLKVTYQ